MKIILRNIHVYATFRGGGTLCILHSGLSRHKARSPVLRSFVVWSRWSWVQVLKAENKNKRKWERNTASVLVASPTTKENLFFYIHWISQHLSLETILGGKSQAPTSFAESMWCPSKQVKQNATIEFHTVCLCYDKPTNSLVLKTKLDHCHVKFSSPCIVPFVS